MTQNEAHYIIILVFTNVVNFCKQMHIKWESSRILVTVSNCFNKSCLQNPCGHNKCFLDHIFSKSILKNLGKRVRLQHLINDPLPRFLVPKLDRQFDYIT